MKKIFLFTVAAILCTSCASRTPDSSIEFHAPLEKVRVQAGWLLNGEFANVCSAIIEGYYEKEGLDVELIPGGPSGSSFIIASNTIAQDDSLTLGIDSDFVPLIRGVTKENPNEKLRVKAFAAFWNGNPYGFIVREDSPLNSLKDFAKKKADGSKYKIGVTADSVIQNAIAKEAGVPVSELEIITVGFNATPFLAGQVDALAAYWTSQAYEAEIAGIPYRFLPASELTAYDQPSMIAVATDKVLKEKPETLKKWLKATIQGSEFLLDNPQKAGEYVLDERCGGKKFDLKQEQWLIEKSLPLFTRGSVGKIHPEQIERFSSAYHDLGEIPYSPALSEFVDFGVYNSVIQQ